MILIWLLLEREAYSSIISAFVAQGELTWKKEVCSNCQFFIFPSFLPLFLKQILTDIRNLLHIPDDYHRLEMQRALTDENLRKIALTRFFLLVSPFIFHLSTSHKSSASHSKKAFHDPSRQITTSSRGMLESTRKGGALSAYAFPPTNNQVLSDIIHFHFLCSNLMLISQQLYQNS